MSVFGINDLFVRARKVKAGDKEDLARAIINILSSEDSKGNNGAEYMSDEAFEYFGFNPEEPDIVDEENKKLAQDNNKIYCLDRYAFETAIKINDEKEMIDYLIDLYDDHWGTELVFVVDFLHNENGQIDTVTAAFAS